MPAEATHCGHFVLSLVTAAASFALSCCSYESEFIVQKYPGIPLRTSSMPTKSIQKFVLLPTGGGPLDAAAWATYEKLSPAAYRLIESCHPRLRRCPPPHQRLGTGMAIETLLKGL